MIKRFIILFVALLAISESFAYDYDIATSDTAGAFYYKLNSPKAGEATLVAGDWQYTGDVVIPASINVNGVNYAITTIGKDAFYYDYDVESVTLGSNVTTIKSYAFERVSAPDNKGIKINLDSDALTSIESNAFHCAVLAPNHGDTLVLGKNINILGGQSNYFSWTTFPNVRHFYVDESSTTLCTSANGILYSKDMKKLYYYPPYLDGTTYEIPSSIETVATYAFYSMQKLKNITGGVNVTSMGSVVSGTVLTLPIGPKVNTMSTDALMYAHADFLPVIDENNKTFALVDNVLYKYESKDTTLCRYFKCNKQATFVVPANVTKIGSYAFYNHQYIQNIDYGQCTKLKSSNIASTAYHSTKYSVNFLNAQNIYVVIDGVYYSDDTTIMVMFGTDVKVKDYVMPSKTKTITVATIKSNDYVRTFAINAATNSINGEYLYPMKNLEAYSVDPANANYSSDSYGVLYDKAKKKLISYPRGNDRLFYKAADATEQVGVHAFYYNQFLEGIDLGDNIKSVIDGNSGNMAYMQNLKFIRVGTVNPPTVTTSSFSSDMYTKNTTLYVPASAFDVYKHASIWNRFAVVKDTGQFMTDVKSTKYNYYTYHYKQNMSGDGYLEPESVKCEGYMLCNTTAEPINYEGFDYIPFEQKLLDNTNVIVKIYYTRNSYDIKWKSNNEVVSSGTFKYGTVITEPSVTVTPEAGKHFIGWNPSSIATTAVTFDENSILRKDTTFYAIFATNDRKPYVVRHFLQNIADNNYPSAPYATDTLSEVFGLQTQATANTYTGFTAPSTISQQTVAEDGSTVVDIYYTRNSYKVDWYNGTTQVSTGNYKYGSALSIPGNPTAEAGKHFVGWNTDINATIALSLEGKTVEGAVTYYAIFADNGSKSYTIEHYLQNIDDTYPSKPSETGNGSGTVGLQTSATSNKYTGFTAPSTINQQTIAEDGSTVVKIYYTRNSYEVDWYNGATQVSTGNYKYGSELSIPGNPTAEAGKHFIGWNTNASAANALALSGVLVETDVTYYAIFVANDNKPYIVNHYQQGLDGNYPATPTTVDNGSYVWGLMTDAKSKSYEGFTAQPFSQVEIKEDGTSKVDIYYTRNIHTLTWSIRYGNLESQSYTKGSVKYGESIIGPSLTREGYALKGWSLSSTGESTVVVATTMPDNDLTYYDVWNVNQYKANWYNNYVGSDEALHTASYFDFGDSIKEPFGIPKRENYKFIGWSKTSNGSVITDGDFGKMTTAGASFYAQWEPDKYTLTWNANGGNLSGTYTSGTVNYGADIVKPTATRLGYKFVGWGETAGATLATTVPLTMPAKNTEFFAIWEINQHTLAWNANGGELSGTYTNGTVAYGTTITAPSASYYGYTFKGWTTTQGSTVTSEITTMPDNDVVYYAVWEANQHTLVWEANGGELSGTYTSGTVAYGTTIVAPTNVSRTGYKFAGWGESATSTNPTTVASTMPDNDVKYYALWVVNDYVVAWLLNDGTDNIYGSNNVTFGNAISKIEPDPSREHYQFLGWSKTADGNVITDYGTMNANEVNFYAQWKINSNNLSWNANGGVLSGTYTSGDVDYGKEIVKPTATRVGHTFEGWASSSTASVSDIVEITTMPDADTTFYAVWSVNTYTANWKFNDGTSGNFTTTEVNYGDYISQPANNPSFEHYKFLGWSATEDGDIISDFGTMDAADTTFYAIWQLNKNVVVWYANNDSDSIFATDTIEYLAEIIPPVETPSRECYHFMGWSSSQSGLAESDFGTMPDNDTAFYAVWAEDVYDAIWYMNDGSDSIFLTTTASVSSPVIAPDTVPVCANYAFQGWSSTTDGEILTNFGVMPAGGTQFYAVWEDVLYDAVWYANNGTADIFFTTHATVSSTLTAPKETPDHGSYIFKGWSSTADGEPLTDLGVMPAGGTSFYAVWAPGEFTVVWDMNDGSGNTYLSQQVVLGEKIVAPNDNPSRKCYEFKGWSATADGDVTTDFGAITVDGAVFYAIWAGIVEFEAPESFETCENDKQVELINVSDSVKFTWKVNGVVEPSQVGTIFTLPDNAKYSGTIAVTGSFGGTEVTKEIKYVRKKDMITTMWDDVISVLNTDSLFQSYKWYHNDILIDTTEYYNEVEGLTGKYYLVATTFGGEEICSCERDFGKKPEASISVYPNPAVERVLVKGNALEVGKSIFITDENGKVWLSREITDNDVEEISLSNLPQGLYIVKIDNKSISFIKL